MNIVIINRTTQERREILSFRRKYIDLEESKMLSIEKMCTDTWKDLYRFIYYKVQNKEEAEDITQETYVKAIDYIERVQPDIDNQLGYLKVIALNIIRDHWRKQKKIGRILTVEDVQSGELESKDFSESTINKVWINEALENLSIDQRRVIELRIVKGYSVAETARVMKKSESAIRVIQFRALKALANLFNKL